LPGGPLNLIAVGLAPNTLDALIEALEIERRSVRCCDGLAEVPRLAAQHPTDLVLWWFDVTDGLVAACQRLFAGGINLPLVCVSRKLDWELERALIENGADDVISPSLPDRLFASIFSLVRRRRREYRLDLAGGLWYDCIRGAIVNGENETLLTPAVLGLFRVLAQDLGNWVPIETVVTCLDIEVPSRHHFALVRQRVQALRNRLLHTGLGVTFSVSTGARLWRKA